MIQKRPFLPWALLALALPIPALGHDTWLLARPSAAQPEEEVVLELTSGMAFPTPETAIKADRRAGGGAARGQDL